MLISADRLFALLSSDFAERPALLDVRWQLGGRPGREAYAAGHIPGAVFIDLELHLAAPPGSGGRHPLPSAESFTTSMRAAGISNGRACVVYDTATSTSAARAWWLLRYFGHDQVTVLDGGLAAWVDAGHPLEKDAAIVEPGHFVALPGGMPILDTEAAAELAVRGVLVDARAPERYRGEIEPIDRVAGHIPGARNLPTTQNVGPAGRFLDPVTLRGAFEKLGVREGVEVGAYCGSGVTAAHEVMALELAGYPAALYVGSWSEWVTDPGRPVAKGHGGEAPLGFAAVMVCAMGPRMSLIEFPADDPERARRFWSGLLGTALDARSGAEGEGWQTHAPAPVVGVHTRGRGPGDSFSLPYFAVSDMAAALEQVKTLGGSVVHRGASWAICKDSEGSPFGLALNAPTVDSSSSQG